MELVVYNMEGIATGCINAFCEFSECDESEVGAAQTPLLDETKDPLVVVQEAKGSLAEAGGHGRVVPHRNQVLDEDHVHRTVCEARPAKSGRGTNHDDYTMG